jgi:hypothetical protein
MKRRYIWGNVKKKLSISALDEACTHHHHHHHHPPSLQAPRRARKYFRRRALQLETLGNPSVSAILLKRFSYLCTHRSISEDMLRPVASRLGYDVSSWHFGRTLLSSSGRSTLCAVLGVIRVQRLGQLASAMSVVCDLEVTCHGDAGRYDTHPSAIKAAFIVL